MLEEKIFTGFYFIVCVYLITFNLMLSLNLPTKGILQFFSTVIYIFIYFQLLILLELMM